MFVYIKHLIFTLLLGNKVLILSRLMLNSCLLFSVSEIFYPLWMLKMTFHFCKFTLYSVHSNIYNFTYYLIFYAFSLYLDYISPSPSSFPSRTLPSHYFYNFTVSFYICLFKLWSPINVVHFLMDMGLSTETWEAYQWLSFTLSSGLQCLECLGDLEIGSWD